MKSWLTIQSLQDLIQEISSSTSRGRPADFVVSVPTNASHASMVRSSRPFRLRYWSVWPECAIAARIAGSLREKTRARSRCVSPILSCQFRKRPSMAGDVMLSHCDRSRTRNRTQQARIYSTVESWTAWSPRENQFSQTPTDAHETVFESIPRQTRRR